MAAIVDQDATRGQILADIATITDLIDRLDGAPTSLKYAEADTLRHVRSELIKTLAAREGVR